MRSEAGGAPIITGLAVVALAMVCSTRHAIRSQKTEQFGLSPSGRGDLDPRHYVAIRMSAAIIETQNMMASCFVTLGVHRRPIFKLVKLASQKKRYERQRPHFDSKPTSILIEVQA
jgi:hypothetical protein